MGSLIVRGRYFWNGSSPKAAENVAMLIEHGKVKAIGDMDSLCGMAPEADRLENDSWLIAPAFVDAHDHGRGITPRSMGVPDDALEVWLQDLNKLAPIPHRIACYYDGVRMAASGVGTVLHSHNPNSFSNMKVSGGRAQKHPLPIVHRSKQADLLRSEPIHCRPSRTFADKLRGRDPGQDHVHGGIPFP